MKTIIPTAALEQHIAVLGKTGSGKTSTGKLLVEQVVGDGNARVCILDTVKSDWWGLTSSADGKKPGLPFHILGGPHGHVPIHASAGKAIAEIVASGALRHSIIDMADFEAGGAQRFFVDFAPALLRNMRGVLYLVIEEAHELAPKERSGFDKENMSVHYAKKLATAGRSKGIRLVVLTQRTQSLHNALLGSCETMIVHRLTAPADQEPVLKWLKANASGGVIEMIAAQISSLKTGAGWVCSGEAKIFERIEFPRIKTYDNSATPTHDSHQHDVKTAPVDQDNLRAIIGTAVKEAEANDPKLLRAEIARLRASAAKKPDPAPATAPSKPSGPRREDLATIAALRKALENAMKFIIEINATGFLDAAGKPIDRAQLEKAITGATEAVQRLVASSLEQRNKDLARLQRQGEQVIKNLQALLEKDVTVQVDVRHNEPFTVSHGSRPAPAPRAVHPATNPEVATLAAAQRKIINALAFLEHVGITPADKTQASLFAGLSPTAGHTQNMYGGLRTAGLIEYPGSGTVVLTAAGRALADPGRVPQSAEEMQQVLLAKVAAAQRKILTVLIESYPNALDKREASDRAGLSPDAGHTQNMYGGLRSLGLIEYPAPGKVVALPVLFLER